MASIPDVVILVGQNRELNAVKECLKLGITLITILDTNCDPTLTDYIVPANDDSISSVSLILNEFSKAIKAWLITENWSFDNLFYFCGFFKIYIKVETLNLYRIVYFTCFINGFVLVLFMNIFVLSNFCYLGFYITIFRKILGLLIESWVTLFFSFYR